MAILRRHNLFPIAGAAAYTVGAAARAYARHNLFPIAGAAANYLGFLQCRNLAATISFPSRGLRLIREGERARLVVPPQSLSHRGGCGTHLRDAHAIVKPRHNLFPIAGAAANLSGSDARRRCTATISFPSRGLRQIADLKTGHPLRPPQSLSHRGGCGEPVRDAWDLALDRHNLFPIAGAAATRRSRISNNSKPATISFPSRGLRRESAKTNVWYFHPPQSLSHRGGCGRGLLDPSHRRLPATISFPSRGLRLYRID